MKRDFFRASLAKAHDGEGMSNPLFPVAKKPLWKKISMAVLAIGLPTGAGGLGVSYLQAPQFQVSSITIEGLSSLDEAKVRAVIGRDLSKRAALFFTHQHQWFFRGEQIVQSLKEQLPIREASVTRNGSAARVVIVEDIVMVLVHSGEHWILIGLDGVILRELSADEVGALNSTESPFFLDKVPKIALEEQIDPAGTQAVIPPARLAALVKLDHNLRARTLTPTSFKLTTRETSWLKVQIAEKSYELLVDLDQDIEAETKMLDAALSAYANEDADLQYIDLRFGKRVYVK